MLTTIVSIFLPCLIISIIITTLIFQKKNLNSIIKYQQQIIESQRNVIGNQNATIDAFKRILEQGVTLHSDKPFWLTDDLCKEIKELWDEGKISNYNSRIKATKIIQEKSLGLDKRKLTLEDAINIIKKHCLNIV